MSEHLHNLDALLADWPFVPGQVLVRNATGHDGRPLLLMRVEMGVLQLETQGRPDGLRFESFPTYYDYLLDQSLEKGPEFGLSTEDCAQIDREFFQFYHRRICWLTLNRYAEAVADAEHSLALMDFSAAYSPDPEWTALHEQHRPFVLFHKVQAEALVQLETPHPRQAVAAIDQGLNELRGSLRTLTEDEQLEQNAFLVKLREMREAIATHYELSPTLAEQLSQAIAAEQYELAARIRDQMGRQP